MATKEDEDDTESSVYPFQFIQQDQKREVGVILEDEVAIAEQQDQHYLPSIDSTLLIRQFPSQGISFKIWAAANTIVNLLQQYHHQPNTSPLSSIFNSLKSHLRILELGSGTGLVGIAAAAILGAKVTITDLPNVISNLQFNSDANSGVLKLNGGSINVSSLRWGEIEDMESIGRDFDVVIGSDLVYHDNLYEPLLKTMQFFLGQESDIVFVMAHSRRWKKESGFFKKARKMFQCLMKYHRYLIDSPAAPCSSLKKLELIYSSKNQVQVIRLLLRSYPNLQALCLKFEENKKLSDVDDKDGYWQSNQKQSADDCFKCLKTVKLKRFKGRESELEHARYLLQYASALEKMKIDYPSPRTLSEERKVTIHEKLLTFPRASPSVAFECVYGGSSF